MHPLSAVAGARAVLAPAALALAMLAAICPPATAQPASGLPPPSPPQGIVRTPGQPAASPAPAPAPAAAHPPRRATAEAFGDPMRVEVRGLPTPAADAALRAAVAEIRAVEALVGAAGDPAGGGVAALHASPGVAVPVDPRLAELLARAVSFCGWSHGAHGPLGGRIYEAWEGGAARPAADRLGPATASAACDGLEVDPGAATARLAPGARLDLRGYSRGFAVDRAVAVLREQGVGNGFVEVGWVRRAFGSGVDGGGWPLLLPVFPGSDRPVDRLALRDRALAVASTVHRPLLVAGDALPPWVDQRTGSPDASGVVGVAASTELAVDAEALAVTLAILGFQEGTLRLGTLRPTPAVLWLLGEGAGAPVVSHYHWADVVLP